MDMRILNIAGLAVSAAAVGSLAAAGGSIKKNMDKLTEVAGDNSDAAAIKRNIYITLGSGVAGGVVAIGYFAARLLRE